MNQELNMFLKEGVKKEYLNAFNTIEYFKTRMAERIESIVKNREKWNGFVYSPKRNSFENKTGSASRWGHWSCTEFDGVIKSNEEKISLQVGVWWKPPELDLPVIFYAGVKKGYEKVKSFQSHISNPKIKCFTSLKIQWLYFQPSEEMDFDHDFNELLDELLNQIS
jgi:hypothetical protein